MKITTVKAGEIARHPTHRMDAEYWVTRHEGDEMANEKTARPTATVDLEHGLDETMAPTWEDNIWPKVMWSSPHVGHSGGHLYALRKDDDGWSASHEFDMKLNILVKGTTRKKAKKKAKAHNKKLFLEHYGFLK